MKWTINFTRSAGKQTKNLSKAAFEALRLLVKDLEVNGPVPGKGWSNYGKLKGSKGDLRHCHLIKGNPTYVCCWEVIDKKIRACLHFAILSQTDLIFEHRSAAYT